MDPTRQYRQWLLLHWLFGESLASLRRALLAAPGSHPEALLALPAARWRHFGAQNVLLERILEWQRGGTPRDVERLLDRLAERLDAGRTRLLVLGTESYPPQLAAIYDPPPLLYCRGRPEVLHGSQLAVVGGRKATALGLRITRELTRAAAHSGLVITSGLALGVDAAAHEAALAASAPTVAVMATGVDGIYPLRHRQLAEAIAASGCLVSEFFPGTPALAHRFPRRNRIIAGLALGTLVTEAARRSGSLITARAALEQGREVMAVPHSVYHVAGAGCNELLRMGATLIGDATDILIALAGAMGRDPAAVERPEAPLGATPSHPSIHAQLGFEPCTVDELAQRSGLDVPTLLTALAELELDGVIARCAGGFIRCR